MDSGSFLKRLRVDEGWSQSDFAVRLGMSPASKGQISDIESGVRPFSMGFLKKLKASRVFSPSEMAVLENLVHDEHGVSQVSHQTSKSSTEIYEMFRQQALDVAQKGYTDAAMYMLQQQIAVIQKSARASSSKKERQVILLAAGRAIIDRLHIASQTLAEDVILNATRHELLLLHELQEQKVLYADPDYNDLGLILRPMITSTANQREEALPLFNYYKNQVHSDYAKTICARDISVIVGILQTQSKLDKREARSMYLDAEENALTVAQESSATFGNRAYIYEGIAFARSLLGLPEVTDNMAQARRWLDQAQDKDAFTATIRSKIARTEVLYLAKSPDTDPDSLLSTVENLMPIFEPFGRRNRHKDQIAADLMKHRSKRVRDYALFLKNKL